MSDRCPKCDGAIYDRTNYVCPVCGTDLPPELLFRPPDMSDFDRLVEGNEIQVELLSRALLELRKARGHPQALRDAAIRYFKAGISRGFEIGPLIEWLFSWPTNRWSVFSQVDFPGKAGREFIEMLKQLTIEDLHSNDTSASG